MSLSRSSFLGTIPEDESPDPSNNDSGQQQEQQGQHAALTTAANNNLSALLLLKHRNKTTATGGATAAISSCRSVDSSTAGVEDVVSDKMSMISDAGGELGVSGGGGGGDTEGDEYDDPNTPASVSVGRVGEPHQKSSWPQKIRTSKRRIAFCRKDYWTRRNIYLAVGAVALVVGVLSAIIAVVVVNSDKNDDAQPLHHNNDAGAAAPEPTMAQVVTAILNETNPDAAALWDNPDSPQSKARDWILSNDTLLDAVLSDGGGGGARLKQRYALALLYFGTGGPDLWHLHSNLTHRNTSSSSSSKSSELVFLNPSLTECEWTGVTCDNATTREDFSSFDAGDSNNQDNNTVFRLFFQGMNLTGPIPVELGTGIPTLRELDFSGNELTGSIPATIFASGWKSSLYWLDLSENQLTGSIPAAVWSLRELLFLFMNNNTLSGKIEMVQEDQPQQQQQTDASAQVHFLKQVWLYNNQLTGSLPTWFEELRDLEEWRTNENELTGSLPNPPGSLSTFDVSNNHLTGTIPDTWWSKMTSPPLKHVYLDHNTLTGRLPDATQPRQFAMEKLWLQHNRLTGEIPADFAQQWTNLVELQVQNNSLTGRLGPPVYVTNANASQLAAECRRLTWPDGKLIKADCLEQVTTDDPPVQCDCCTACE